MKRALRRLLTAVAVVSLIYVGFSAAADVGDGYRREVKFMAG